MSSCPDLCGRAYLMIINIFIMLIGLLSLAGGLFLKFGQSIIFPQLEPLLDEALSGAGDLMPDSSDLYTEMGATFDVAAYVLIASGSFTLIIAIIGCAGASCTVRALLATYAALLLLIFVAKIVWLGIWVSKAVDDQMFAAMALNVKEKYTGPTSFNPESLMLNAIMVQLQCCGVSSYVEFEDAVNWNKTLEITDGTTTYVYEQLIPITCCKVTGSFPDITPTDTNCTIVPTSVNSNMDTSCSKAVAAVIDANKVLVFGIYATILAFELSCSSVAICLLVRNRKQQNQIHPQNESSRTSDSHNGPDGMNADKVDPM